MKRILIAAAALVLSASLCAAKDEPAPPPLKFADMPAYQVAATSVEIDDQDHTPREYPQVGYLAPTTFADALDEWVAQRFQLTGGSVNKLRVTLREGRITEKILPITKGIRGWFKKEESVEYEALLNLEIAIVAPSGEVLSHADSSTWVSQTMLEGVTTAKKEAAWAQMVNAAFENVDRELKTRLTEYMGAYIK